jgi:hypothetical protein
MNKFYVTPILQEGRQCYMANYPIARVRGEKGPWRRKQKKFSQLGAALEFLEGAQLEWERSGGVSLKYDRQLHYDLLKAQRILAGVPNSSLELASRVYRSCASRREYRGGRFEAPTDRRLELSPRGILALQGKARAWNCSVSQACERVLWQWLELEAARGVRVEVELEKEKYAQGKRELMRREALLDVEGGKELLEIEYMEKFAPELAARVIREELERERHALYMREWRAKKEAQRRATLWSKA